MNRPILRFHPKAWGKLLFHQDQSDGNEVGLMAITSPDDPLYITDLWLPKQEVTGATVEFDDDDLANRVMQFAEDGVEPANCCRIWLHTHPFKSATPSKTDRDTFGDQFEGVEWAVMFILAEDGTIHCELRADLSIGGTVTQNLPVHVDWTALVNHETEEAEFEAKVEEKIIPQWKKNSGPRTHIPNRQGDGSPYGKAKPKGGECDGRCPSFQDLGVYDTEDLLELLDEK